MSGSGSADFPSFLSPDQAALAAAIANFKPTPKEVISGIAPHVFDERKRRRRRSMRRSSTRPYSTGDLTVKRVGGESSPLRVYEITSDEGGV